jgi:hypothetical protein
MYNILINNYCFLIKKLLRLVILICPMLLGLGIDQTRPIFDRPELDLRKIFESKSGLCPIKGFFSDLA